MNILPKKRWHVRTKDNIARVRRDEAEAREKERQRQEKLEFAESEARINFLRKKSGIPVKQNETSEVGTNSCSTKELPTNADGHVDLFADYKTHIKTTNKELEKEKKEEQEKYEKQIGYLTYLGQDTNEALKLRSWYEVAPERAIVGEVSTERDLKTKHSNDPLTLINALLPPEKKPSESKLKRKRSRSPLIREKAVHETESKGPKPEEESQSRSRSVKKHKKEKRHKKEKHHKKEKRNRKEKKQRKAEEREKEFQRQQQQQLKREKLERLRKERLRREANERARQETLLAPKEPEIKEPKSVAATPRIVQKYNSQFNPELAKQNML